MLEDFSQEEIAEKLGVSQPTVSRDMQALDVEAAEMARKMNDVELRFNLVWKAFQEIDKAVSVAFEHYEKIDQSDSRSKYETLRILTGLLGRKCYLITYMKASISLLGEPRDGLKTQFAQLKKTVEEFGRQMGLMPAAAPANIVSSRPAANDGSDGPQDGEGPA